MKRATPVLVTKAFSLFISIHALVKRATYAFITDVEYVNNISIHALVKRATQSCGGNNLVVRFQSTPS